MHRIFLVLGIGLIRISSRVRVRIRVNVTVNIIVRINIRTSWVMNIVLFRYYPGDLSPNN